MRHDVYWFNPLPTVRADRAVRLWLPFDCHRTSCRANRVLGLREAREAREIDSIRAQHATVS